MMYDIHIHIIPGVDDGAWSMEMAVSMVIMAYQQGVRKIVATPHSSAFFAGEELVKQHYRALCERIQTIYPEEQIYLGCEIFCQKHNMQNILLELKSGILPTMNATKYVLTEFSTSVTPEDAKYCIRALLEEGWIPIIAHIERYGFLFIEEGTIEYMKETGCFFQVNVYSLYEEEREEIKRNARQLLERKYIDFLGSDAHRMNHRSPSVELGLQYVYQICDKNYADEITFKNAENYIMKMGGTT